MLVLLQHVYSMSSISKVTIENLGENHKHIAVHWQYKHNAHYMVEKVMTGHMFNLSTAALLIPSKAYVKFHHVDSTSLVMPYGFCNKQCFFMGLKSVSKHDHPLNWLLPLEF